MELVRAKDILKTPKDFTNEQIKRAASVLMVKLLEAERQVGSLEKIVEHQEEVCKAYVGDIHKDKTPTFFRPKEMGDFITNIAESTVLSHVVFLKIAEGLASHGLVDSEIKIRLSAISTMCKD